MNAHNEQQARQLLALGLDEFGHHTEAANVRKGIDLDEYKVDLWAIRAALDAQPSPVVKQNLTTQAAAAQEAVAWQRRYIKTGGPWYSISKEIYETTKNGEWAGRYEVRELYAAPVTAAPGIDLTALADRITDHLCEHEYDIGGRDELLRHVREAIDASSKGATFPNDGNSEAQFVADGERLNCPACGGSGHVEDSPKGGSEARDAVLAALVEAATAVERADADGELTNDLVDRLRAARDAAQASSHGAGVES